MFTTFVNQYCTGLAKKLNNAIPAKAESKPWLHVAILVTNYNEDGILDNKYQLNLDKSDTAYYAIYVWDTREVIESGTIRNFKQYSDLYPLTKRARFNKVPVARDNNQKLHGSDIAVNIINKVIFK
jgi:hypothetical protein